MKNYYLFFLIFVTITFLVSCDRFSTPTEQNARDYLTNWVGKNGRLVSLKKTNGQMLDGVYRMQVEVKFDCSQVGGGMVWCCSRGMSSLIAREREPQNQIWIEFHKTERGWVVLQSPSFGC